MVGGGGGGVVGQRAREKGERVEAAVAAVGESTVVHNYVSIVAVIVIVDLDVDVVASGAVPEVGGPSSFEGSANAVRQVTRLRCASGPRELWYSSLEDVE